MSNDLVKVMDIERVERKVPIKKLFSVEIDFLEKGFSVKREDYASQQLMFPLSFSLNMMLHETHVIANFNDCCLLYTEINGEEASLAGLKITILYGKNKAGIMVSGFKDWEDIVITDDSTIDAKNWCQLYLSDEVADIFFSCLPAVGIGAKHVVFHAERDSASVKSVLRHFAQIALMGKGLPEGEISEDDDEENQPEKVGGDSE